MRKGWHNESYRHALAAKGISTKKVRLFSGLWDKTKYSRLQRQSTASAGVPLQQLTGKGEYLPEERAASARLEITGRLGARTKEVALQDMFNNLDPRVTVGPDGKRIGEKLGEYRKRILGEIPEKTQIAPSNDPASEAGQRVDKLIGAKYLLPEESMMGIYLEEVEEKQKNGNILVRKVPKERIKPEDERKKLYEYVYDEKLKKFVDPLSEVEIGGKSPDTEHGVKLTGDVFKEWEKKTFVPDKNLEREDILARQEASGNRQFSEFSYPEAKPEEPVVKKEDYNPETQWFKPEARTIGERINARLERKDVNTKLYKLPKGFQ